MHHGSCLCGAITYTVSGELGPLMCCHCTRCRKANGSAFLAAAQVVPDDFKLHDPHGLLKAWESSPGVLRKFCGQCGSPLFSHRPGPPEVIRLRVGTLDTPCDGPVAMHIFCQDRAAWLDSAEHAPRHARRP